MPQDESPRNESSADESFEGESNVSIDGKGRFGIPGRYRKLLAERSEGQVVITLAFTPVTALNPETEPFRRYRGLSIFPLPTWRSFRSNLERRERFDPVRATFSVFVASALTCDIDSQGRILVPPALRGFLNRRSPAGKKLPEDGEQDHNRLKLVGVTERFELWREEVWEAVREEMLAAAAQRLQDDRAARRADPDAKTYDLPL